MNHVAGIILLDNFWFYGISEAGEKNFEFRTFYSANLKSYHIYFKKSGVESIVLAPFMVF
jgi:hypothetical protein